MRDGDYDDMGDALRLLEAWDEEWFGEIENEGDWLHGRDFCDKHIDGYDGGFEWPSPWGMDPSHCAAIVAIQERVCELTEDSE